jgi:hypothetical protein
MRTRPVAWPGLAGKAPALRHPWRLLLLQPGNRRGPAGGATRSLLTRTAKAIRSTSESGCGRYAAIEQPISDLVIGDNT